MLIIKESHTDLEIENYIPPNINMASVARGCAKMLNVLFTYRFAIHSQMPGRVQPTNRLRVGKSVMFVGNEKDESLFSHFPQSRRHQHFGTI